MSHQVQLSPAASHRPTAVLDPAGHAAKPPACRGRCPPLPRPDMRRIVSHLEIRSSRPSFTPRQRFPGEPGTGTAGPPWPGSVPLWRRSSAACPTARCAPKKPSSCASPTATCPPRLGDADPDPGRAPHRQGMDRHRIQPSAAWPQAPARVPIPPVLVAMLHHHLRPRAGETSSLRTPARTGNPLSGAVCAC